MEPGTDASRLIRDTEALLAEAKRSLEGTEGFLASNAGKAGEMLTQVKRQREEDLRSYVAEQVKQAQLQPALPLPDIAIDSATKFARQVRRRRAVV